MGKVKLSFNVTWFLRKVCGGIAPLLRKVTVNWPAVDISICLHLSEWQICTFRVLTIVTSTIRVSTIKNCSQTWKLQESLNFLHLKFILHPSNIDIQADPVYLLFSLSLLAMSSTISRRISCAVLSIFFFFFCWRLHSLSLQWEYFCLVLRCL